MGWFGKIALGSLGMMFGGPLGAVLGAALGHHFIDKKEAQARERFQIPGAPVDSVASHQAAGFVCILSILAKIAKADGVVTQDELAVVDRFIKSLTISADEQDFARRVFNEAKHSPYSLEDFTAQFYRMTQAQPAVLCSFLDVLFQVAAADGELHPAEEQAIKKVRDIFRLTDAQFDGIRARYFQNDDKYYAMLNCTARSTDEEIKKSYKKLVKDFHPDTVIAKGLPDEFIQFATRRFQEIQEAYEQVSKKRGL
jgi:DnaJ like chaperone protein